MSVKETMLNRLQTRKPFTPLHKDFYCSQDDYQVDLELIWYHDWLFVGHDCEVPNTGDYFTLQVGDYPVIVVRDREGSIRAFHNSCRHRGSRICPTDRGNAPRLVCPYHQWTYALDGRLLAARDMGPTFDKTLYGLKSVHCATVGGYVWISLAKVAPDFEPVRKQLEPYFAPHMLAKDTKVAFVSTTIENANWKLVWENNRECYHCNANHPELCKTFPEDPAVTGVGGAANDPRISAKVRHWEQIGLPSEFQIAASGQYRVARMPLIEGCVAYTMTGNAAVNRPLTPNVTEKDIGTLLLFHYPTTWNHVMGDHAISFRLLPISPTQTQLTTKWLVHKDAVEGRDYDLKELTEVWIATNAADKRICQENQIGVSSPAYDPAPYSPVHEDGAAQFVDWYALAMEERLAQTK